KDFLVPASAAATVAAASTAAAATTATEAAALAAAFGLRSGLVDGQGAAVHLFAVEGGDGGLGLLVAAHLHEAEALGAAGVPVHDHLRRLHRPVRREHLLERAVGNPVSEVAHVQLLAHLGLLEESGRGRPRRGGAAPGRHG